MRLRLGLTLLMAKPVGRSKQFTSKLVFGKDATIKTYSRDRYGRTIGDVILPDGRILNQEFVRAGLAWWYEKYSKDAALRDLEEETRHANGTPSVVHGFTLALLLHGSG